MKLRITVFTVIFILSISGIVNKGLSQNQIKSENLDVTKSNADSIINGYANSEVPELPNMGGMVFKGLFSLIIVFALIIGFALFLKKFVYNRNGFRVSGGLVKVISTTFIGPKKSIHLIKVMDKILVVGVTDNQMQTLAEFKEGDIPNSLVENRKIDESTKQYSSYFSHIFDKVRKKNHQ
jgi:flagellar biosynthetic protein FliO